MIAEDDHIYFSLQYSHHDPASRIKNLTFQWSWGFHDIHHEFYDPIVEWLEQPYLESSVIGNKFQSILMLAKKLGED